MQRVESECKKKESFSVAIARSCHLSGICDTCMRMHFEPCSKAGLMYRGHISSGTISHRLTGFRSPYASKRTMIYSPGCPRFLSKSPFTVFKARAHTHTHTTHQETNDYRVTRIIRQRSIFQVVIVDFRGEERSIDIRSLNNLLIVNLIYRPPCDHW